MCLREITDPGCGRWPALPSRTDSIAMAHLLTFLAAFMVVVVLHVGTIALAAGWVGVHVRRVAIGIGPALFQAGRFRLGPLPIGGYVNLRSTRDEEVAAHDLHTALDQRSVPEQVFIVLSGCLALLLVAFAALGPDALPAALNAPGQFFAGLVSPQGEAQQILREAVATVQATPFVALLGLTAAKCAALNLLPLPILNGGEAIAVCARRLGLRKGWPDAATQWLAHGWLLAVAVWLYAVGFYVVGA
jgi:membrane-associated protease RseP (regulator of RpoE activity)